MGGLAGSIARSGAAERTTRAPMSRALSKRLDRLEERLQPEGPPRCWQIVYVSHEGTENGPIIEWKPGHTGNVRSAGSPSWASQGEK